MRQKRQRAGVRQPDAVSAMGSRECDIAVSEMTGIPLDRLCGYIVITVAHRADKRHELSIMPAADDWPWVQRWLDRAAADVRGMP